MCESDAWMFLTSHMGRAKKILYLILHVSCVHNCSHKLKTKKKIFEKIHSENTGNQVQMSNMI